ncbi:hypothetical protein C0995_007369 [Termitomyces sp. Mi166|nr:hypothetical protein C0995_007369 [Termitomyces sp. Mi166\
MAASAAEKYSEDGLPPFTPMPWSEFPPNSDHQGLSNLSLLERSLKEIRAAIPSKYFIRDMRKGMLYLARDVLMATVVLSLATTIDPYFKQAATRELLTPLGSEVARWAAWSVYWWFQGLIFTGIWVIGHECGHGAFSDHKIVNDVLGFITHTILWTPYFSWKISHHRHHNNHASMERDEVYVPKTREDLNIPDEVAGQEIDYDEIFGDTPIYTLYMLIRQQLLAFPAYLPNSILFTKAQRNAVIVSNVGIAAMVWAVSHACITHGTANVIKYYGIPWLEVTHWFIMITYLHHTDPTLPHYRNKEWNFQRGAAATIDRNFLGWQGRFFLHDVAHYHVIHHFFPKMPFYHGYEATQHLRAFIGDHYAYSNKPAFQALWESYNKCQFVENEGDVLFYRDRKGHAVRRPADQYRVQSIKSQ